MKIIAALVALTLPLTAQWLDHKDPRTPRTKDGKPDLSGVWEAERTPLSDLKRVLGEETAKVQVDLTDVTKYMINVFWDTKDSEQLLRPEAAALTKQRAGLDFVTARCWPAGVPAGQLVDPFKIIQAPRQLAVISGIGDPTRQIYTDGRSLPQDPVPSWMGSSVGRWQGGTLVVETTGFTEKSWLDAFGHPRSSSMRIRERYRRRDFGHMDLEVMFDDPAYYTRPFSIQIQLDLLPDTDVLEYVCTDNEKDRTHVEKASTAAPPKVAEPVR